MITKDYIVKVIIRRLIYIAIAALIAFISHEAKADFTYGTDTTIYATSAEACTAYASYLTSTQVSQHIVFTYYQFNSPRTCVFSRTQNGSSISDFTGLLSPVATPTCTAPQVYNYQTQSCGDPPNPCSSKTGQISKGGYLGTIDQTHVCSAGCDTTKLNTTTCADGLCFVDLKYTGSSCPTDDTAPSSPEGECLAQGKSYGTINGVVTCLARTDVSAIPTTDQSTTTNNTTNNIDNSNNSTSTTTTTTVNGGTVTTTTTTTGTDADGNPVNTTQSSDQPKDNFCEQNPNSKLCKDTENTFQGSCGGGFSCEGDAITCAIAKRTEQEHCDALNSQAALNANTATATGQNLLNGQYDTDVQGFLDGTNTESNTTVDIPNSLSESGEASFSSQGFDDLSVTAMGRTITLPFTKVNPYLEWFGYLLLGLTYLSAFKIINSGI